MNKSKELRDLFRKSLFNKRNNTYINDRIIFNDENDIKIYFYEWSDINRVPRTFNDIVSFEDYLKACGIFMHLYQRDIIANCGTVFAVCYKGTKELNLRSSYANLVDSMNEHDRLSKEIESKKESSNGEGGKIIDSGENFFCRWSPMYSRSNIERPKMIDESGEYWFG